MMTPHLLKQLEEKVNVHRRWGPASPETSFERIAYMSLALAGEAGELANFVKKDWREAASLPTAVLHRRAEIVSELADVGNYAFMLASLLGVDLLEEMLIKMIEVEGRPHMRKPL